MCTYRDDRLADGRVGQDASATDWRGQWGDNGDGLVISKTADECADLLKQPEKLAALLEEYLVRLMLLSFVSF